MPEDHVRRARDRLRKLKQTGSVSKYLSEFRNLVLTIPDVTDGEKWDRFCAGLKYDVRLEVIKSSFTTFEEAAQLALSIDSAIFSARASQEMRGSSSSNGTVPMEIGNMESKSPRFSQERMKDLRNDACFTCHKPGCRPWKHGNKKPFISNIEVDEGVEVKNDDKSNVHLVE